MENDDLRDLFAGLAMMGILAAGCDEGNGDVARMSYCLADAMMRERIPAEGIASIKKPRKRKESLNDQVE